MVKRALSVSKIRVSKSETSANERAFLIAGKEKLA